MKVLIFGAGGQVGEALDRVLDRATYEVKALTRDDQGGDISDFSAVESEIKAFAPDVIVNAAAFTQVDLAETQVGTAFDVNHKAVANLARCAKLCGALLIHFGTDFVFDGSGEKPWSEEDRVNPLNQYGVSKLAGEQAILASGCRHVILRVSWVHSAGHKNFITSLVGWMHKQPNVSVIDDQWGSPTSADDIARGVCAVIPRAIEDCSVDGIYHFANDGYTTRFGCAEYVASLLQSSSVGALKPVDSSVFELPAIRPLNCRLNTEKFRKTFSYQPRSWQDGVRDTVRGGL